MDSFNIDNVNLNFVNIHEPRRLYMGDAGTQESYGFAFIVNDEFQRQMLVDMGVRPSSTIENAFSVKNKNRIPITSDDYGLLINIFKIADVRNLSRDVLFNGVRANIIVRPYHSRIRGSERLILGVEQVLVCAKDIADNFGKF